MSRRSSAASSFEILPAYSHLPTRSPSGLSVPTTRPASEERFVFVERNRPVSRTSSDSHTYASIPSSNSSFVPSRSSTPRGAQPLIGQSSRSVTPSVRSTSLGQGAIGQQVINSPNPPSSTSSIRPNSHNQLAVRTSTPNTQLQQAIGRQLTQLEHSTLPSTGQQITLPSSLPPPYLASSTNSTSSRKSNSRQSIVKPPRPLSQSTSNSFRPQVATGVFEPVQPRNPQTIQPAILPLQSAIQQRPTALSIQQTPVALPPMQQIPFQPLQPIVQPTAVRFHTAPTPSGPATYDEVASVRSESRATPQNLPITHPQVPGVPLGYVPHPALDGYGVQPNVHPSLQPGVQPGAYPNVYPNIQPFLQPTIQPLVQPTIQPIQSPVQIPIVTSPGAEDLESPPPYSVQTTAIAPHVQPQAFQFPPQIVNRCIGCSNHFTEPICRPHCCCCRCRARIVFVSSCGGPCYSSCY